MDKIITKEPEIRLRKGTPNAFDDGISAALICYSGDLIDPATKSEKYLRVIGDGCYQGKHHTVFQHATFSFDLKNISRQVVWALLHAQPNYNTSQASQRYCRLDEISAVIPPFQKEENKKVFEEIIIEAWQSYNELSKILTEDVTKYYCEKFRKNPENLTENDMESIDKKAIEIARYVVPIAAHTTLDYTVNGLTLHRLNRLANEGDTNWEASTIISKMIDEVRKHDPKFFEKIEDQMPLEETLEYKIFKEYGYLIDEKALYEFDQQLGGLRSKLEDYSQNAEKILADSIRLAMGIPEDRMSDEAAIDFILDPRKNFYLSEKLNLSMHSPIMRAMNHVNYTFKKKISHTGDSQDQRHRTVPASRPVLMFHDTEKPDYLTPYLIENSPKAKEIYDNLMKKIWTVKDILLNDGEDIELTQYLLPNAKAIRYFETGSLLYLHHKFNNRSCLNAQEEIWRITMEEIKQIKEVHPRIGKYLGQPTCLNRYQLGATPTCLEGKRFCGVKVWEKFPEIERKI